MYKLYDNDTDALIGTINSVQLKFMIDQLEEESSQDRDYYINLATLDMFELRGAEPELLAVLRKGLGDREDMEIRWVLK